MGDLHAMDAENPRLPLYPLRILRVAKGTSHFVRMLSASYRGLMTHFVKGRSVYCQPSGCEAALHKMPQFWKGYAAVQVYDFTAEHWLSAVLEISEGLELDLRGQYARGQVWEISRAGVKGRGEPPVVGRYHELLDVRQLPEAFDYLPCLLHLYHVRELLLNAVNPLPPRVMATATKGAPPAGTVQAAEKPLSPEAQAEFRARLRKEGFLRTDTYKPRNGKV